MNDGRSYRAFISYSHEDARAAKWMQRAIETYRVPRHLVKSLGLEGHRMGRVFRDRDELGSASSLSDAITAALDESECLIVVCSPAVIESKWVHEEIVYFRSHYPGRPVLPLIVEGDPDAVLPDALRFKVTSDGEIVWEYISPYWTSRHYYGRINWVFRAYRYAADSAQIQNRI